MKSLQTREILTGDAEWDRQHRLLHALLARLEGTVAVLKQSGEAEAPTVRHEFGEILSETLAVMVKHFDWEETLMRTLPPSPLVDAHCDFHREAHKAIADKLSTLALEMDQKPLPESVESLARILFDWITAHIRGYDQSFVRLLTADGWKLQT